MLTYGALWQAVASHVPLTLVAVGAVIITLLVTVWMYRVGERKKFILAVWSLVIAILITGTTIILRDLEAQRRQWAAVCLNETRLVGLLTEAGGHHLITRDTPVTDPAYRKLVDLHAELCREFKSVGYIYTLREVAPRQMVYICSCASDINGDGQIDGTKELEDPPYTPYDDKWCDVFGKALAGHAAIQRVVSPVYGEWITAVVPLHNPDGQVEAILGLDFFPQRWREISNSLGGRSLLLLVAALTVVLLASTYWAAMRRSMRELARTHHELTSAQQAAQIAAAAKECFLANINHEIRTPLNAIVGMSGIMRDKIAERVPPELAAEIADMVKQVQQSSDDLVSLIDGILELAQFDVPGTVAAEVWFPLHSLLSEVASKFRPLVEKKGLAFSCNCSPTTIWIKSDAQKLGRVLWRLLDNAIKFTTTGEAALLATVVDATDEDITNSMTSMLSTPSAGLSSVLSSRLLSAVHHNENEVGTRRVLRLQVRDTGVGIEKEKLGMLFHAFSQVDATSTRRYGGVGVGLAIVSRLAEMFHGRIAVESTEGVGTTMTLSVTLWGSEDDPAELYDSHGTHASVATNPSTFFPTMGRLSGTVSATRSGTIGAGGSASTKPLAGVHVLLVEDTKINQIVLTTMLGDAGAAVTIADNGQIAVDKIAAGLVVDIVLMDLQMPVMDGYTATQRLRTMRLTQPIVAVTAHAIAEERTRALTAGCDAFVIKPVNRQLLINTMLTLLPPKNTP